jgi:RNA polymerase sigma-B factor
MSAVRSRPPTALDVDALLERFADDHDPRDLDALVRRFGPLARKLAHRYARPGENAEDLEQVAYLGLMKALRGFEPARGFAFTSYATPTILGELKRHFRGASWSAHVPRAVQERSAKLRKARTRLETDLGRSPTVNELGEAIGADTEDVLEALRALESMHSTSLDAPVSDEVDSSLGDQIGDVDPGYERADDLAAIQRAVEVLTDEQRLVLRLRFQDNLKQSDIAAKLGVSQMQISRVLNGALERARVVAEHHSTVPAR